MKLSANVPRKRGNELPKKCESGFLLLPCIDLQLIVVWGSSAWHQQQPFETQFVVSTPTDGPAAAPLGLQSINAAACKNCYSFTQRTCCHTCLTSVAVPPQLPPPANAGDTPDAARQSPAGLQPLPLRPCLDHTYDMKAPHAPYHTLCITHRPAAAATVDYTTPAPDPPPHTRPCAHKTKYPPSPA